MKTTTDTLTGKPFRYNSTDIHVSEDGTRTVVPARYTQSDAIWLHPNRTPAKLLARLNPPNETR